MKTYSEYLEKKARALKEEQREAFWVGARAMHKAFKWRKRELAKKKKLEAK